MGVDDLIPDELESSSSSGGSSKKDSSEDQLHKVIGSGKQKKGFTEEQWEGVKKVIARETEYTVNEVLHMPAQKRYDILHECALEATSEESTLPDDYRSEIRCYECGNDCSSGYVELEGKDFCVQHTAGQIAVALGDGVKDNL